MSSEPLIQPGGDTPLSSGEESLRLQTLILANMTEGVVVSNEAGIIVYTNAAEDATFGYQAGELVGKHVTILNAYEPEANARRVEEVGNELKAHGFWDGDWFNRRKDGSTFITSSHISVVEIGGRRLWLCVQKDVTRERQALRFLQESEERYRSLVQATAAIVWTTTADGALHGDQPQWRAFSGQSTGELDGDGWLAAIHPDDRELTRACWRDALRGQKRYEVEHRVRRADGEYRFMRARGVPIIEAGQVREWVGLHVDVTAERELRELLDLERDRLRETFMRAPAFIATLRGPEHVFEVTNPLYRDLIGGRDVVGMPVRKALPEIEGQGFIELLDRVYSTGEPFLGSDVRVVLTRSSGPEERFVDFVYQPITSGDEITGIFVHGNDVTEQVHARRKAEAQTAELERALVALEYQSQLNKTITDNAASCLFMMDERGHPTFMNPAAEQVTGYFLSEIRNQPLHEAVHHRHPDGRPYPMADCPIDNGREKLIALKDYRDVFVRKDGTFFPVSCYVAPLEREGRTVGAVLEFRDITEDLRAQEALREADRRKDEFLATLSHELRTPLTAILGWARLLRLEGNDEETVRSGLETIEKSAAIQSQLIEDVLDLSRIISGKIRIGADVVDVAAVATEALESVRLAAAAKRIHLRVEHPPNSDKTLILGDPNRLQQIIWNLLTNAIKFTPAGGSVRLGVERDGGSVLLTVVDSGIGITPEFLPDVFAPFRQAESSTTRAHGGLGLGLSIVRHLVELHGGRVSVASEGKDRGATFTVELPLLRDVPSGTGLADDAGALQAERKEAEPLVRLEGLTVLVLDDQEAIREFLATVLQRAGANVHLAASVREGTGVVSRHDCDLILCDISMPHEDGFAFIEWLRSRKERRIPAVAITAFGRAEDHARLMESGFDAVVLKPVEPAKLTRLLRTLVESTTVNDR